MSLAASLKSILPEPTRESSRIVAGSSSGDDSSTLDVPTDSISSTLLKKVREQYDKIPAYGERDDWRPRNGDDFGDGGAFPEIHMPQFPLGMGRNVPNSSYGSLVQGGSQALVPVMTDAEGRTRFDAIAQYGHSAGTVVHSRPSDLVGRYYRDEELERPDEDEVKSNIERTKAAIQAKLNSVQVNTNASRPNEASVSARPEAQIVKYTAAVGSQNGSSELSHRMVQIVEKRSDPLEPPKFRVSKSVIAPSEAPVPVLQSAPQKASKEDAEAWALPPSLSNWNNSRGYTVALDKRLASEALARPETQISSKFATMAAALDTAQQSAREQVAYRARLEQQKQLQQRELEDQQAKEIARLARLKRAGILAEAEALETEEEREARLARDAVRDEMRRNLEDETRRARMGKAAKATSSSSSRSSADRDISEKIALGQAVPRSQETLYDQRLFNQTQGLDHGWVNEEDYNLYDKPLLAGGREEALYKGTNQREGEIYGEQFSLDKLTRSDGKKGGRTGPVEFERDEDEAKQQRLEEIERQKSLQARRSDSPGRRSDSPRRRYSPVRRSPSPARRSPSPPRRSRDYPSPPRRHRSPPSSPVRSKRTSDDEDQADPMDAMLNFMSDAKSSRKREREESRRGPTLGMMHAVGGSSGTVEDYRDNKRSKVSFVSTQEPHRIREDSRRNDMEREREGRSDRSQHYDDDRDDRRYDDRRFSSRDRRDYRRDDRREDYGRSNRDSDKDEFGRDRK